MKFLASLLLFAAGTAGAHPMGNFSVSHYAKIEVTEKGVELVYALDLAEIPTFDLLVIRLGCGRGPEFSEALRRATARRRQRQSSDLSRRSASRFHLRADMQYLVRWCSPYRCRRDGCATTLRNRD